MAYTYEIPRKHSKDEYRLYDIWMAWNENVSHKFAKLPCNTLEYKTFQQDAMI